MFLKVKMLRNVPDQYKLSQQWWTVSLLMYNFQEFRCICIVILGNFSLTTFRMIVRFVNFLQLALNDSFGNLAGLIAAKLVIYDCSKIINDLLISTFTFDNYNTIFNAPKQNITCKMGIISKMCNILYFYSSKILKEYLSFSGIVFYLNILYVCCRI